MNCKHPIKFFKVPLNSITHKEGLTPMLQNAGDMMKTYYIYKYLFLI